MKRVDEDVAYVVVTWVILENNPVNVEVVEYGTVTVAVTDVIVAELQVNVVAVPAPLVAVLTVVVEPAYEVVVEITVEEMIGV